MALSLPGGKSMEELHAAARAAADEHPLQLPEGDSTLRRLVETVRTQPDPRVAVTTALVALLHVPSRPRLAFPGGRPGRSAGKDGTPTPQKQQQQPGGAAAAEQAAAAVKLEPGTEGDAAAAPKAEPGSTVVATAGEAAAGEPEGEPLPDAATYLDAYPTVKSLLVLCW